LHVITKSAMGSLLLGHSVYVDKHSTVVVVNDADIHATMTMITCAGE